MYLNRSYSLWKKTRKLYKITVTAWLPLWIRIIIVKLVWAHHYQVSMYMCGWIIYHGHKTLFCQRLYEEPIERATNFLCHLSMLHRVFVLRAFLLYILCLDDNFLKTQKCCCVVIHSASKMGLKKSISSTLCQFASELGFSMKPMWFIGYTILEYFNVVVLPQTVQVEKFYVSK